MRTYGSLEAAAVSTIPRAIEYDRLRLTEVSSRQNPLVEQNDTGTEGNPQAGRRLVIEQGMASEDTYAM